LLRERVDADGDDDDLTIHYTYDAAGNRTERTVVARGGAAATSFLYDDNDRILTEARTVTTASRGGRRPLVAGVPFLINPSSTWHGVLRVIEVALVLLVAIALFAAMRSAWRRRHRRVPRLVLGWATRTAVWTALFVLAVGPRNIQAATVNGRLFRDQERALEAGQQERDLDGKGDFEAGELGDGVADAERSGRSLGDFPGGELLRYTWDADGNMLSRSDGSATDSFAYDARNRLVSAQIETVADGEATSYEYDADGVRTAKTVGDVTTRYLVDTNRMYAEVVLETTADSEVSYVHGDDLVSMTRPDGQGGVRYYHYDGQMSTRQLSDADGSIVDTYDYDAFGNLVESSGTTENAYRYTGEQVDANTGFYYLRARYYDPERGRFLTQDPFPGIASDPSTLHKYLYTGSDPVNYRDPSGLMANTTLIGLMVTIVIVGVLAGIAIVYTASMKDLAEVMANFGLAVGILIGLAIGPGTQPLAFAAAAVGVVHGAGQVLADGPLPDEEALRDSAIAVRFAKGFLQGVSQFIAMALTVVGVVATGLPAIFLGAALAVVIQVLQDVLGALLGGTDSTGALGVNMSLAKSFIRLLTDGLRDGLIGSGISLAFGYIKDRIRSFLAAT